MQSIQGESFPEFTRELSSQTKRKNERKKSKNSISCFIQESFQNAPRKMSFHPHPGTQSPFLEEGMNERRKDRERREFS